MMGLSFVVFLLQFEFHEEWQIIEMRKIQLFCLIINDFHSKYFIFAPLLLAQTRNESEVLNIKE